MTGKARNRVQVAAGAGKVRQAEMAERMRAEGRNTGTQQYRQAVGRSADHGIAHHTGAQVFVLVCQFEWISH